MQSKLRRTQSGGRHPFHKAAKSITTSEGRYTFYAITICAVIGIFLYQPMAVLVQKLSPALSPQAATNLAHLITFGLCAVLLVTILLKLRAIIAAIENRRLKTFNRRLQKRKESETSNG